MATLFKKGDVVKLTVQVPTGPVKSLRMLDDGTVQCLIEWTDSNGNTQQRWFDESELSAA
jgi:uncharacterized protein YodC (DUF2158 family)